MEPLAELMDEIRSFNRERDWEQFHSPKNLAMALIVEAAELAEHFQWMTPEESRRPGDRALAKVREEIGDVFLYVLNLCDKLGIEPLAAAREKLARNREKYPADRVRGSSRKYTEYE